MLGNSFDDVLGDELVDRHGRPAADRLADSLIQMAD